MEEKELTEFEWEMQALQQLVDPENYVPCISSAELMDQEFTPAEFVVKGYLPKGLCVLGGTPKIGKSWMMLDLCLHVAKGEPFLGMEDASSVTATVIHIMAFLAMAQSEKTSILGQLHRLLSRAKILPNNESPPRNRWGFFMATGGCLFFGTLTI